MPRAAKKNASRKRQRKTPPIVQTGGGTFAQIRNALWTLRDHWNDVNAIKRDLPDYSTLVDRSRYNSDWGIPSFKGVNDQWGLYYANQKIVDNAWLESNLYLPVQTNAMNDIKTQMNALYSDCTAKVGVMTAGISSLTNFYDTYSSLWLQTNDIYTMYYTASVALIPDATYNGWKSTSSSSTPYPTDTPSDSEITNAKLSNGLALTVWADNYLLDLINGTGAASFCVRRGNVYKSYLNLIDNSPVTSALNAIDANLTKAIDLVAQSDIIARQTQMNIFKLSRVIMGYVIYADHSATVPVIFMTAPPNTCIYMNTQTLLVYTITRDKVIDNTAMIDALNGCLDFNEKYKELNNIDQTIAALPDNSLVKALAFKETIATKMANLKVTDIVPPPPPPPPAFTGYGKWVDANAQAAAANGQGTINVVDSSGNNVLLNGAVWTQDGVWTITFNGSLRSYFFSNNVKYDVTIIA